MNPLSWFVELMKPPKYYWSADPKKKFDTVLICHNKLFPPVGSRPYGAQPIHTKSNVWDRSAALHTEFVLEELLGECGVYWHIVNDPVDNRFAVLSNDDGGWVVSAKLMGYGWLVDDLVVATDRRVK